MNRRNKQYELTSDSDDEISAYIELFCAHIEKYQRDILSIERQKYSGKNFTLPEYSGYYNTLINAARDKNILPREKEKEKEILQDRDVKFKLVSLKCHYKITKSKLERASTILLDYTDRTPTSKPHRKRSRNSSKETYTNKRSRDGSNTRTKRQPITHQFKRHQANENWYCRCKLGMTLKKNIKQHLQGSTQNLANKNFLT